jgi:hypothetical protein
MPILFGGLAQRTRMPTTTFMFLFVVSVACLGWMTIVVRRMTREAAPRVAEDLDTVSRSGLAGVAAVPAGTLAFAPLSQANRRLAAGSE